jgi:D-arabinose 5-phosphate isomerase GutQ
MAKEINFDVRTLGTRACQELEVVFAKVEPSQLEKAQRIVCYGIGREGLMMDARYGNMK